MGRYDRLCGDEDEIYSEFQKIKEARYEAHGDEENEDWYCNQFVDPRDMVTADR